MKRTLAVSTLVAAAVLLFAVPTFAHNDLSLIDTHGAVTISEEVQLHIDKGDELFAKGDYSAARREYDAAAKLARAEGELPTEALRRMANAHYYEGRYQSAAGVLEKLAKEASEYGDLATQAWAIADAAWVGWKAGDTIDVNRRVARLERLMTSPYLPDDVKEEIRAKRLGNYAMAAGL